MNRSLCIAMALLALFAAGCEQVTVDCDMHIEPAAHSQGLVGQSKWALSDMTIKGVARRKPDIRATISFKADSAHGSTGCNHFSGPYTAEADGSFASNGFTMTEMSCEHMQQEADFIALLSSANHYSIENGTLTLSDGTATNVLRFVPYQPNSLPLQGTRWTLTHLTESNEATVSARVVSSEPAVWLQIEDGQATGSGGCNRFRGGVKTGDNATISFQQVASTEKYCGDDVNKQEADFFQLLPQMTKYQIRENVLTLSNADDTLGLQFDGSETDKKP